MVPKSNNLDNSLEIDNNINKFKSRRNSIYDIPNMNLKKLKKKCIKNMLNKKYFINIIKKEILNFFFMFQKINIQWINFEILIYKFADEKK